MGRGADVRPGQSSPVDICAFVLKIYAMQAKATPEQLQALTSFLGIQQATITAELGENWYPDRGVGPIPPTDPVIYRLYEAVLVYGHPLKVSCPFYASASTEDLFEQAVIHEKFGDGIMSMIDCTVRVERKPHPKGDRVVLTFE